MPKLEDLTNKKFNKLTVISRDTSKKTDLIGFVNVIVATQFLFVQIY